MPKKDKNIEFLLNGYDKRMKLFDRELVYNYKLALTNLKAKLSKFYEIHGETVTITEKNNEKIRKRIIPANKVNQVKIMQNLNASIEREMNKIYTKNGLAIKTISKDIMTEGYYHTLYDTAQQTKLDGLFGQIDTRVIEKSLNNNFDRLAEIDANRLDRIALSRSLTQGFISGDGYFEIAKRMEEAAEKKAWNWTRVARTEGNRVQNEAITEAYDFAESKGVEIQRQWNSTIDSRTRPAHARLDGQIKGSKLKDMYYDSQSGYSTDMPGHGSAEQVINCRCREIAVIEGLEPRTRRIRGEGIVANQSFKEYAQSNGLKKNEYGQSYKFKK